MNLVEAAVMMERLQRRAATPDEFDALQAARDALLTIVSEGYFTIAARLRGESFPLAPHHGAGQSGIAPVNMLD